jgi:hypothetical protein
LVAFRRAVDCVIEAWEMFKTAIASCRASRTYPVAGTDWEVCIAKAAVWRPYD